MCLLSVNLYEFGQFLEILLWISLPMVLIVLLVTTYLHYRKKRREATEETDAPYHSVPDWTYPSPATPYQPAAKDFSGEKSRPSGDRLASGLFIGDPTAALPKESGNAYRGLLWMKDKYEQYREQTDRKFEKLKEELARSEEKYLNLLASRSPRETPALQEISSTEAQQEVSPTEAPRDSTEAPQDPPLEEASLRDQIEEKDQQIGFLQLELEQRIRNYHQLEYQGREDKARSEELAGQYLQAQELLAARQSKIEELDELLVQEKDKFADLAAKLECNIRLLRRIHQEMDRSLNAEESGPDQSPPLSEVSKIVGWV